MVTGESGTTKLRFSFTIYCRSYLNVKKLLSAFLFLRIAFALRKNCLCDVFYRSYLCMQLIELIGSFRQNTWIKLAEDVKVGHVISYGGLAKLLSKPGTLSTFLCSSSMLSQN